MSLFSTPKLWRTLHLKIFFMRKLKMVVTDLDGTLLQDDHSISEVDLETLNLLGELGICRVAATGRNPFKLRKALTPSHPFDYVICSSGACIIDWHSQKIIRAINFPEKDTVQLIQYLISHGYNFKVSDRLPDNHNFFWWKNHECPEIDRYIDVHSKMGNAEEILPNIKYESSQLLLFFPKNSNSFDLVKKELLSHFSNISIIKTTSPIDDNWTWMEIYPKGISKAHGIEEVCRLKNIHRSETLGIGNDFNDLEMLNFTNLSYVVNNAPDELKEKFLISLPYHENGFSHAIRQHLSDSENSL
jgi:Cof subfamily protein (haloacid dehalogenase superfamily)